MKTYFPRWSARPSRLIALSALLLWFPNCALAGQGVNIALRTSFNSAPYLLELIETAAAENATSYFPLLDSVADGHFASAVSDEELYELFLALLQDAGHIRDAATLSAFQFALSIRSTAPRIEAHYQYYNTTVAPALKSTTMDSECSALLEQRQFDRVLGEETNLPISILYTDINDPNFGYFHHTLSRNAREGKTSYRLRYKRSPAADSRPLYVSGYGVELALKRTDYIVIDDRDATKNTNQAEVVGSVPVESKATKNVSDLRPLSTSELVELGLKASSFVMESENPFSTLVRLSQDFPKHSSEIATHNVSKNFLDEYHFNRRIILPHGNSIVWMNGAQLDARHFNSFALSQLLRNERQLIAGLASCGLSSPQAINLLSHAELATSRVAGEAQRYDYRDIEEGGDIIVWLNDLERDKRYRGWPSSITTFLQRTYPGQLPQVRKDVHRLVVPVDLSSAEDVNIIVEQLAAFVKRTIPITFGIVPLTKDAPASGHAKVAYHLHKTYGIAAVLKYLRSFQASKRIGGPSESDFAAAVEGTKTRTGATPLSWEDLRQSEALDDQVRRSQIYIKRLRADTDIPLIFANGVALPRDETWLQSMSQQVGQDLQMVQQGIFESSIKEDTWLPGLFLSKASRYRNDLIIPADEASIRFVDLTKLHHDHADALEQLPTMAISGNESKAQWSQLVVIVDLKSTQGLRLLQEAVLVRMDDQSIQILLQHNPMAPKDHTPHLLVETNEEDERAYVKLLRNAEELSSRGFWRQRQPLLDASGLAPGQQGLIVNGRMLGPIPSESPFTSSEIMQLLSYERTKRSEPLFATLTALDLTDKIDSPTAFARLISLIARSSESDVPGDVFETPPAARIDIFKQWQSNHTAIVTGDPGTSLIQIVAGIDPASQIGQRYIPILKVLSELDGVSLQLFLNPKEMLQELPIKRFYRHVLESKPSFDEAGAVRSPTARFADVPEEALLNVAMDVPPAWLVAPKESVHDLDNIKLSNIKDGTDVEATYELEHILIEGHSRDVTMGPPPRGAQLLLGTAKEPHTADTLVMTNLGYFQFKANPGFWNIHLQEGRSKQIFHIDSVGSMGYLPQPGDHTTEVELLSFQGLTLFPRLSRKAGQETEDVLEAATEHAKPDSPLGYVSKGLHLAQSILSKSGLTTSSHSQIEPHADINIFSVASGHLYERMLNIMMVSVMAHTNHTVHFWFIEQFLSPSFKSFLPHLAAHYNFRYSMVTYKWPHWLRAQSEKQREIWGYKILFLDVLFPLSLPKIIFVDADQIVRTDLHSLITLDLEGAPYGFTPMCDSRTEMEGFRFWKTGYWKSFLRGKAYHISALYVVDLVAFRQMAAGDRLRQHYQQLSADPNSLSNLDQDLPNHMQHNLPIFSLPQDWLWCETWCADNALESAKTIDLCNNPLTKEPKLERARRQVPEWTTYDDEIEAVRRRVLGLDPHEQEAQPVETTITGSAGELTKPTDTAMKEAPIKDHSSEKIKDEL